MDNGWELEAIHEQFDIFEKLTTPCTKVAGKDLIRPLNTAIKNIINEHSRFRNHKHYDIQRKVCHEIIQYVHTHQNDVPNVKIKLSFIVLVTNLEENNRLCKIPVFIIQLDKKSVYIDMNTTVYNTWEDFKIKMDLPACTFCSPVGGIYKVGQQLKIEFSKSPAPYLYRSLLCLGIAVVGAGVVASSFFYTIPRTILKIAGSLIPIAKTFIPSIERFCLESYLELVKTAQAFKRGEISLSKFTDDAWKLLTKLQSNFHEELSEVRLNLQKKLQSAYRYLCDSLYNYLKNAPESAKNLFLAITHKVDNDMITLETDIDKQIKAACQNKAIWECNITKGERKDRTNQHIFENCANDYVLHEMTGKKNEISQDLQSYSYRQKTVDIVNISLNVASNLNKNKLTDVKYILESINNIVKVEYQHKMDNYKQGVLAAKQVAEDKFDVAKYNKYRGISGDPKDHYWIETLKCLKTLYFSIKINKEITHLQNKEKICVIPVLNQNDDNSVMYYFNGVQGAGKISARSLLDILKDENSNMKNIVPYEILEISSIMSIHSEEYIIIIKQEIDKDNTSTGSIVVVRTSW